MQRFRCVMMCGLAAWVLCAAFPVAGAQEQENELWIDPRFEYVEGEVIVPFVVLENGDLMSFRGGQVRVSEDDGKTWSEGWPIETDNPDGPLSMAKGVRTKNGDIVLVGTGPVVTKWEWDPETRSAGNPRRDIWTMRSGDGGKTWTHHQRILEGYCGAIIDIKALDSGDVLIPAQLYMDDPGRHATRSYLSKDGGKTWEKGNIIDLGGSGHHDGAFETTVVDLKDGRIWMLVRTSLGRFWNAYSNDGGHYFRTLEPSLIESSNSPAYLIRLSSGRLLMAWNPEKPVGSKPPMRGGQYSEVPASWYRYSIQLAFSEDDGETWIGPITIAHLKNGNISYPYIIERSPGLIWMRSGINLEWIEVHESELIGE